MKTKLHEALRQHCKSEHQFTSDALKGSYALMSSQHERYGKGCMWLQAHWFMRDLQESYPSLTFEIARKSIEAMKDGREPKGIIDLLAQTWLKPDGDSE